MNILRTIKLKQLNGDLDNLNEKERLFFSFFADATEEQDNNGNIYIIKNKECIFKYIKGVLYCKYNIIWVDLSNGGKLNNVRIKIFIQETMSKYLNIEVLADWADFLDKPKR